jgi:hypothetical protein
MQRKSVLRRLADGIDHEHLNRSSGRFELEDELASTIANEIHVKLTPAEKTRLAPTRRVNPAAYDAYLKGRYSFNRPSDENLAQAISQFQKAVGLDPNFAPAYSGLSDAYLWAGYNEGVFDRDRSQYKGEDCRGKRPFNSTPIPPKGTHRSRSSKRSGFSFWTFVAFIVSSSFAWLSGHLLEA